MLAWQDRMSKGARVGPEVELLLSRNLVGFLLVFFALDLVGLAALAID